MTDRSYVDIEPVVDHAPTDNPSPNFERRDNPIEIDDEVHMRSPNVKKLFSDQNKGTDLRVPLPPKRKACFFLSFSGFVILYLIFFFVIAYTYPLKPEVHIKQFYLPVFDTISPNITQEMKDLVFLKLRFNNRNELISVSYDDILNITVYYLPNSTTSTIHFANTTLPGFYQHKGKPVTEVVQISAPGLPGLIKQQESGRMLFHMNLEFNMRFHCREIGKHKHRFLMKAEFQIPLETVPSSEFTIPMYDKSF